MMYEGELSVSDFDLAWMKDSSCVEESAPPQFDLLAPKTPCTPLNQSTFEIELLIDNREIRSKEDRGFIKSKLDAAGVISSIVTLELGDFVWVAKKKTQLDKKKLFQTQGE
eukprot:Sdes_comp19315_c0_seq2m10447